MVPSIQQIIATINPDLYYKVSDDKGEAKRELKEFKELIQKQGFQKAAEQAKAKPDAEYTLGYDSSSETLEPIYFFIIDLMNDFALESEKLVDNFSSSPGSGHFAELGQRATVMQQQASKIMGDVGIVMRGVLNIIYDLREFRIRLEHYDNVKLKDEGKNQAALLSLKQIWIDKVDFLKGNTSIKAMALGGQAGYQTLIDAFMVVKDEKDVKKLDLNKRVRRILLPRISEFRMWLEQSERELRKRYELEKTYLRGQVNNLKLYARWAKPYLKAAQQLEGKEVGREPAMVKAFNTILLQLTLLGKLRVKPKEAAIAGDLPIDFQKLKTRRDYYTCVLVDFNFRGIPRKIGQQPHYVFGGKAEVRFSAYALNEDELKKLDEELDKSDFGDVMALIEGTTTESLGHLQEEIDFFLEEVKEEEQEKSQDQSNPFKALVGGYDKKPEKPALKEKPRQILVRPDNFIEREHLRRFALEKAEETAFKLFDVYKKAHGMPSYT